MAVSAKNRDFGNNCRTLVDKAFNLGDIFRLFYGEAGPMKRKAILPTLLFLISLSFGCSSIDPVSGREYLGYLPARGYDLLDMFELNLGIDKGFCSLPGLSGFSCFISAGCEPWALGGGIFDCEKFGFDGRLFGQWNEKRCELNLLILGSLVKYEKTPNWGNRYLYDHEYCPLINDPKDEDRFFSNKRGVFGKGMWADKDFSSRFYDHERRLFDSSIEVHTGFLALEAGISPMEIMDFIVGLIGIDAISDDDWVKPMSERRIPLFEEEGENEADKESAVLVVE